MALLYQRILSEFPQNGLRAAFAYGPCVYKQFRQAFGFSDIIDFIFVVDNPTVWHKENLSKYPSHYSFIKYLGSETIISMQNYFHVYFNTLIRMENILIKYGVISTDCFINDLKYWNQLYVTGILHKPVTWIRENISESDVLENLDIEILKSRKQNLEQAVSIALLLLPETFSEEELFFRICKLSYKNSLVLGYDNSKVKRLVWGRDNDFRKLYSPILNDFPQVDWKSAYSNLLMRDCSQEGQKALAQFIPMNVCTVIRKHYEEMSNSKDDSWSIERMMELPQNTYLIESALKSIASDSNRFHIPYFAITAGPSKVLPYTVRKFWNMIGCN